MAPTNTTATMEPLPEPPTTSSDTFSDFFTTSDLNLPDSDASTVSDESGELHPHEDEDNEESKFPRSDRDADAIDKLLAEEVEKLSLEEKERVIFDVHGMSHGGTDPDDIDSLLEQLDVAICKTPDKKAYEVARYYNESYVTDRAFRLMFLRCEGYNIKATAQRIVSHFEVKKGFFGEGEILGRDVQISDFSETDMKVFKTGYWQILPVRDTAGRMILFQSPALLMPIAPVSEESMVRVIFYIHMIMARMEDVQRNGMVIVSWWPDKAFSPNKVFKFLNSKMSRVRFGVPRKISCVHFLISQSYLRPLVTGVRWFIRNDVTARTRCHFGDLKQMKFELQTYGIPTDCLPMRSEDGGSHPENHDQWIISQRKREEEGNTDDDIIVPRRFDVLFGRTHHTRSHTGNLRAAHIVEMFRAKYEAAGKYEKTEIAERIVDLIGESHGRFLKWEDDAWVEVDHQVARNKISHFYRNARTKARTKKKKKASEPASDSSTHPESDTESQATKRSQSESESEPEQKRSQQRRVS